MTDAPPLAILTVCTGNICRSPVMERLLQQALGSSAVVTSAGTGAVVGAPIHPQMASQLDAAGVPSGDFEARAITPAHLRDADLIVTATADHRARVLREVPGALRRTFTLLELAALTELLADELAEIDDPRERVAVLARNRSLRRGAPGSDDIADPYGRSQEDYRTAYREIAAAVTMTASALLPR